MAGGKIFRPPKAAGKFFGLYPGNLIPRWFFLLARVCMKHCRSSQARHHIWGSAKGEYISQKKTCKICYTITNVCMVDLKAIFSQQDDVIQNSTEKTDSKHECICLTLKKARSSNRLFLRFCPAGAVVASSRKQPFQTIFFPQWNPCCHVTVHQRGLQRTCSEYK